MVIADAVEKRMVRSMPWSGGLRRRPDARLWSNVCWVLTPE